MSLWRTLIIIMPLFFAVNSARALELRSETFMTRNAGKVIFNHDTHMKRPEMKHDCKTCHNSIFQMKKRVSHSMTEMEGGASCGACHNGTVAFAVRECVRCHKVKEITYRVKTTGTVLFSHNTHLAKYPCSSCHNEIFNAGPNKRITMAAMEKGKSCGACHEGKTAFSISKCTVCHPTKDRDYPIKGAGTVRFDHKTHLGSYGCKDCHAKLYPLGARKKVHTMATMNSGKSCGGCHNDSIAFTVRGNCATCHKVS